jgi:sulfite exporter TauE/SafE
LLRVNKPNNSFFEVWLNQKTAFLWVKVSKNLGRNHQRGARWFGGMVWGLVPCGLVYSVLPLAFLSGDPFSGGLLMLAFGLGTMPNLILISGFSGYMASLSHSKWTRYVAALLMFLTGLYGLYRAFTLSDALLKGGFCIASTLNYNIHLVG